LIVGLIETRLRAWRKTSSPPVLEMRCGLLEIDGEKLRVHSLEGPAEEVREVLLGLAEAVGEDSDGDGDA
jgi:hypothetical protein